MTRAQRRLHWMLWPVLALVIAGVTGAALNERARVAAEAADVETG